MATKTAEGLSRSESRSARLLRWLRECVRFLRAAVAARNISELWARIYDDIFGTANLLGDQSLYINLGYWARNPATIDEASADLARLVADEAELNDGDVVIDVGCGYGDQDFLWAEEFGAGQIIGVNIAPKQIEIANARAADRGLDSKVSYLKGSAGDLPRADRSATKVVALESAHHFPSRPEFFAEAYRVLHPGGRLVTADIIPRSAADVPKGVNKFALLGALSRTIFLADRVNRLDSAHYRQALQEAGFDDVRLFSIRQQVYPALAAYSRAKFFKDRDMRRVHPVGRIFFGWIGIAIWGPWLDYVVAVANKPVAALPDLSEQPALEPA